MAITEGSMIETRRSEAQKGHLFVHTLHSASFFHTAVDVTWSATLKNRPALPSWLHLVPSRFKAVAYLVGTPVTAARQVTVHVFAKRLDTYQIKQQYIVISMSEDGELEKSLRDAFRGKDVNPYIYSIEPEFQVPQGKEHLFHHQKSGLESLTNSVDAIDLNDHSFALRLDVVGVDYILKDIVQAESGLHPGKRFYKNPRKKDMVLNESLKCGQPIRVTVHATRLNGRFIVIRSIHSATPFV
ncbi:hypothetical protein KIN20_008997 [Parelaphostrongylus tenuis]|uniref:Sarcoglycan alpha/epsilon N-terminal domain-containing protein n=1 Tax=Parelaphostrongylus tenuis TaxID=148309 RepID=A0AAD5QHX5_PARTN|nr:hypothetical protein KIN20_008997 [Parelaphostrongylus tenuis]